ATKFSFTPLEILNAFSKLPLFPRIFHSLCKSQQPILDVSKSSTLPDCALHPYNYVVERLATALEENSFQLHPRTLLSEMSVTMVVPTRYGTYIYHGPASALHQPAPTASSSDDPGQTERANEAPDSTVLNGYAIIDGSNCIIARSTTGIFNINTRHTQKGHKGQRQSLVFIGDGSNLIDGGETGTMQVVINTICVCALVGATTLLLSHKWK
ncbi:hypothetical protein F4805DRAFT_473983, partial [Annulohypoxylon moriforme]